jgi:hypothetical protein
VFLRCGTFQSVYSINFRLRLNLLWLRPQPSATISPSLEEHVFNRLFCIAALALALASSAFAQQSDADAPATKADVDKYLEVTHANTMAKQMMQSMAKPMHQMIHEQFVKDQDKLPPDFEAHMYKVMDEMMQNMPFDEMMQAMEPAYEKHFTKGDMQALTAFYSTPTGQKILSEMPAIMAEAMQQMMPILQKYTAQMQDRMRTEFAQASKPATNSN